MRILVTAGPTREYIDDVRYVSNASSGRMGCALVDAAKAAGANVSLVCGPIGLAMPACDEVVRVTSTEEMHRAVLDRAAAADVVLMAAAVADFTPDRRIPGKLKKSPRTLLVRFLPTPDILAELGRTKRPGQVLVGFALESADHRENALAKLHRKNLDLIVLNTPAAMGAERSSVELIFAGGASERIDDAPKEETARRIVDAALKLVKDKHA